MMIRPANRIRTAVLISTLSLGLLGAPSATAEKQLLWGDTHLHTTYSSDAYTNNNLTATPDTAFRYAKGQPVVHPYQTRALRLDSSREL